MVKTCGSARNTRQVPLSRIREASPKLLLHPVPSHWQNSVAGFQQEQDTTASWLPRKGLVDAFTREGSRVKKNEIKSFAATWMGLEVIILSEVSQTEKEKYHIISHMLLLLSHFSRVWLFETPWTAAYQAPPSMGFSKQESWSGVPLPSLIISHICEI